MIRNQVAVLAGNGLSIAVNPDLALHRLTQRLVDEFKSRANDPSEISTALAALAEAAVPGNADSVDDFERLVGAFSGATGQLGHLVAIATGLESDKRYNTVRNALDEVVAFLEELRVTAIALVLHDIQERSRTDTSPENPAVALLEGVSAMDPLRVWIANLNYDTILLSAALTAFGDDLCDAGDGRYKVRVRHRGETVTGLRLREAVTDYPATRCTLVHLHGSLTYWVTANGFHVKLRREDVSMLNPWDAYADGAIGGKPVVVLDGPSAKSDEISKFPFSVAYQMFERGLRRAGYWLIVGYSFRDIAVNERLRARFLEQDPKPRILVVTLGDDPSRELIERTLGWGAEDGDSHEYLFIARSGVENVTDTFEWEEWSADV